VYYMTEVRIRPEKHRFEMTVDGEVAGYTEYRSASGVRAFVHTVIEERFEGQGLAAALVAAALEATRTEGLLVEPYCPYVRSFIAKHPEYLDLVPEDRREQFGLPHTPVVERKGA
jgi:predicted GNAT family acetyltransferase